MDAGQQCHSWKLNVQAKAKNLDFKLVASNFLPNCKFFPFSLKFKYCRFLIHLKSETPTFPNPQKSKSLKSKLHRFLERLRIRRRSKNNSRAISSKPKNKATISQSSVVVGNLALFIQSLYQRDKDGIVKLGSIVFICFASIFKSFMARKAWILLVFVIGAIVFCSNVMHLRFSSHFDHHCLSRLFWRAFKNAAFSQVKTQSPFLCYSYYAKMLSHPC
uniref:Uncharacterized protein isoform X1 n=2 Tax=Nicotiana TaxID=4085 RepID=A0A1S4BZ29_TOBAC|nr:PREDICTED: uncharacterized protein LOC104217187 isoform X1 [Nicotiana sylvestris]XP_016494088.1 PREDICTED: uncharacterized protein LOC107813345 isoform X1 [Nicotiana tabacum]